MNPTQTQLEALYRQCYRLTNEHMQPIHIVRIDEQTRNIYILAGFQEEIELQIKPDGEVI